MSFLSICSSNWPESDNKKEMVEQFFGRRQRAKTLVINQHHVRHNDVTTEIMAALRNHPSITRLYASNIRMGPKSAAALGRTLVHNRVLTDVNIRSNCIRADGTKSFCAALTNHSTLKKLSLSKNNIRDAPGSRIAHALALNTGLRHLNMSANYLKDEFGVAFAKALKTNTILEIVNLRDNKIRDAGAKAIGEALRTNESVTDLDIGNNDITDEGAETLFGALETNTALTSLNVSMMSYQLAGTRALVKGLAANITLKHLVMNYNFKSNCGLGVRVAEALSTNTSLTHIDVSQIGMGNKGFVELAHALKTNTTLTSIRMGDHTVSEEGTEAIARALRMNRTLMYVDMMPTRISQTSAGSIASAMQENASIIHMRLTKLKKNFRHCVPMGVQLIVNERLRLIVPAFLLGAAHLPYVQRLVASAKFAAPRKVEDAVARYGEESKTWRANPLATSDVSAIILSYLDPDFKFTLGKRKRKLDN